MSEITEEQYAAAIPGCCAYQGIEAHKNGLGLCWGLVRAVEKGEKMDCSGCDLATRTSPSNGETR
jgi:hypothetical protein